MKNQQKLVGGLIAGAVLGIAVGMLLAPGSGENTRKKIIDGSMRIKDDAIASMNGSLESLKKQFINKIDQLAGGGKEVVSHTNEKVKV